MDKSASYMTRVRLYGRLGREFGKEHRVSVASVAEAVKAIDSRRPGFRSRVLSMKHHKFGVRVGKRQIGEMEIPMMTRGQTITITPVAEGSAGSKGWIQLIAGVVLIAAGAVLTAGTGIGAAIAPYMIQLGIGLALGGIASLLASSPPTPQEQGKSRASYLFSSAQNISVQGAARPLAYGKVFCGSVLTSVDITNADVGRGSDRSPRNDNPASVGGGGTDGSLGALNPGRVIGGVSPQYQLSRDEIRQMITDVNISGARSNVSGAGGGDGGATGGNEDPDTLQSRGRARMEHVICEGTIRGLVGAVDHNGEGDRSIYFNDTPIRNPDGTLNFGTFHDPDETDPNRMTKSKMEWYFNVGTQTQSFFPGFDEEASAFGDGVQLKYGSPNDSAPPDDSFKKIYTFTNPDLDAVRFDIRVPRLEQIDKDDGDIHGSKVKLLFELNTNGGGWVEQIRDTINGKASGPYVRTFKIEMPVGSQPGPWQVRITRLTPDSNKARLLNDTFIDSRSEVVYVKLRHPNTCKAGLVFDSDQFSTIPNVTFHIYGQLVKIPTNYDGDTHINTGSWDGTFKTGWTCNPAWVLWDIITQNRYGLGRYVDASLLDKWEFYRCAQYCDALVPNGLGGTERRYECHTYIAGREDAIKVLRDVASIMRSQVAYIGGLLVPLQDRPVTAPEYAFQFSPDNVVDGEFEFSNVSRKQARTVALVSFNDRTDFGRRKIEPVEDHEQVLRYGVREANITAMGCYSRGQAHRMGKWLLFTEKIRSELCGLTTGLEGSAYRPNDVGRVQAPFRAGKALSGRIHSATSTTVTLDKSITILSGKVYHIDLFGVAGAIETATVANTPGTYTTLTLTAALASVPAPQSVWMLEEGTLVPELYRILTLRTTDKLKTEISLLNYNDSLYDAVELDYKIEEPVTSVLPSATQCSPPANVRIRELTRLNSVTGPQRVLEITWDASNDKFLKDYVVAFRRNNDNWRPLPATNLSTLDLPITLEGDYEFNVIARNVLGVPSQSAYGNYTVDDINPSSAQISGLELIPNGGNSTTFTGRDCQFIWRINSSLVPHMWWRDPMQSTRFDPFFETFEVQIIRLSDNRIILREETKNPVYSFTLEKNIKANGGTPLSTFKISVRFKDRFSNLSEEESMIVSKAPPTEVPANVTASAVMNGITVAWDKPADKSIVKINFWLNANPFYKDSFPDVQAAASASADSTIKTITGLNNGPPGYLLYIESEDCYGQTTHTHFDAVDPDKGVIEDLSFVAGRFYPGVPDEIAETSIPPVTANPPPGHVPTGSWVLELDCALPGSRIYYTSGTSTPTDADGEFVRGTGGIHHTGSFTLTALAYYNGVPGTSPRTFVYTELALGMIAPVFTPRGATYYTNSGTLDVKIGSASVTDWIFYTTDNTAPQHSAASPTGTTKRVANNTTFTLPPGTTVFKAIAYRAGWADSAQVSAVYKVIKSKPSGGVGGGNGPLP